MDPVFVLVHSPSVGPLTWAPVADLLRQRGHDVVVPSLVDVADAQPPFWPAVVGAIRTALSGLEPGQPLVLVAHSNAGLFVPQLVADLAPSVHACLFVDAALPVRAGETPVVPAEFLDVLRGMVTEGRLRPWTDWWDEEDVAPMFPDRLTRDVVSAEQPRLPLAYYEQAVPAPPGWDTVPCGYLLFGPPYDAIAAEARDRGLLVEELAGRHLHQLVEPAATADRLLAMTERLRMHHRRA